MRFRRQYIFLVIFLQGLLLTCMSHSLQAQGLQRSLTEEGEASSSYSPQHPSLFYPTLATELAAHPLLPPVWKASTAEAVVFRSSVVRSIDSLFNIQLIDQSYHVSTLTTLLRTVPNEQIVLEKDTTQVAIRYFMDALLATAFDLYRGPKAVSIVGYDKVSAAYRQRDDSVIKAAVLSVSTQAQLHRLLASLEPTQREYVHLKKAFYDRQRKYQYSARTSMQDTLFKIRHALQLYRWLFHFKLDRFLLVNIAAATAQYRVQDRVLVAMRTIVGKPSTPTPRFASYCNQLILYPYWYVPSSIAIGEYLSKIKRNPHWLDDRNMQVIDAKGRVVDHHQLRWSQFNAAYFPYTIRQSTGCDNALGVLKFDIETPYGVYLHDTNHKAAFLQPSRFLSHGCIRLEEPLLLGNLLLGGGLDTTYLQSCYVDKKPVVRVLPEPLAVFCLYLPAAIDERGQLQLYRDVYRRFKN